MLLVRFRCPLASCVTLLGLGLAGCVRGDPVYLQRCERVALPNAGRDIDLQLIWKGTLGQLHPAEVHLRVGADEWRIALRCDGLRVSEYLVRHSTAGVTANVTSVRPELLDETRGIRCDPPLLWPDLP